MQGALDRLEESRGPDRLKVKVEAFRRYGRVLPFTLSAIQVREAWVGDFSYALWL